MNTLILVRHAEAKHLTKSLKGGWTDTQLTTKGRRQAKLVAQRLAGDLENRDVKLFSSDLIRAVDTAKEICDALNLRLNIVEGLREIHLGEATGMTNAEAEKIYNSPTEPILDWQAYPGSETWRQFHERICGCMDELVGAVGDVGVIVSHSGTMVNIVNWWLELDMEDVARVTYRVHPAAITVVGRSSLGEKTIERLNDVCHLVAGGLSPEYGNLVGKVL